MIAKKVQLCVKIIYAKNKFFFGKKINHFFKNNKFCYSDAKIIKKKIFLKKNDALS